MVRDTNFLLCSVVLFLILMNLGFVFGEVLGTETANYSVTPRYLNRTYNTRVNITISTVNLSKSVTNNISNVSIILPMQATFYAGSNGNAGTIGGVTFSNSTVGTQTLLVWNNVTHGLVTNNTNASFWFNVSLTGLTPASAFRIFNITARFYSGEENSSNYEYQVNFEFEGYVKNETGHNESNVNLTMYQFVEGQNGPPTETFEASVLSNITGYFKFPSVNGSASNYKLKMIRYGPGAGCTSALTNGSCNATKVGTIIPPFPAEMFFPGEAPPAEFEFMKRPTLNGTSFYLQPAATIRLYAYGNKSQQKFGYEVMDRGTGFPIESNVQAAVNTTDIVVPVNRTVSVMFTRMPGSTFAFHQDCNGIFLNYTHCPTPPISNNSILVNPGVIYILNMSLETTQYRLYGCINISDGQNNSGLNITSIIPKMVPWAGFVPPMKADMGDINLSNGKQLNYSVSNLTGNPNYNCSGGLAFYNISVIGAASPGISYLMEFYAKNASSEAGNPGSAWNLAAFQNVSITGDTNMNVTLRRLYGNYVTNQGDANTSKMKFNMQNSTGGALTNSMNANVKVKNPVFGTITYVIESMSSGVFYLPILNNSNWAKVMAFANDAPPREISSNFSLTETNVTLVSMTEGKGIGMKRINSTGQMDMINVTQSSFNINMRFLRNSVACNVREPDSSCEITSMVGKDFNPLLALVAGKINMEMRINSTNTTLTFMNFDMFAAKQPPMDSIMNENKISGTGANSVWQFGSFAPVSTYEYAIISMPYAAGDINESLDINLKTPYFYDENWNKIWDSTAGNTDVNLNDDFIDYNYSATAGELYKNYTTTTGQVCSKTDSSLSTNPCFVNLTTHMIYMKIPHFSGVGPNVVGTALATAGTTDTSTSGGGTVSYWTTTKIITNTEFVSGVEKSFAVKERAKVLVSSQDHYIGVVAITATTVTINVSSATQQATLSIGEEKKFEVNTDGNYDISVKLVSINGTSKVNLLIKSISEKITQETTTPAGETTGATGTTSGTTAQEAQKVSTFGWWIIIIISIILIVIVIYFLIKRKNKSQPQFKKNSKFY